jgi:hypothetical protein
MIRSKVASTFNRTSSAELTFDIGVSVGSGDGLFDGESIINTCCNGSFVGESEKTGG